MSLSELLRWQWTGYPQYHRARANLLLHILVVPVFVLGSIVLVVGIAQASWLLAAAGVVAMVGSIG